MNAPRPVPSFDSILKVAVFVRITESKCVAAFIDIELK
jgi:hypothetical protein